MKLCEAQKVINIIQTSANKIDMVNPILEMVEITGVAEGGTQRKPRTFKPKKCEACGKEFTPNSGKQKLCEECRLLKDTAAELAGMEGEDD